MSPAEMEISPITRKEHDISPENSWDFSRNGESIAVIQAEMGGLNQQENSPWFQNMSED